MALLRRPRYPLLGPLSGGIIGKQLLTSRLTGFDCHHQPDGTQRHPPLDQPVRVRHRSVGSAHLGRFPLPVLDPGRRGRGPHDRRVRGEELHAACHGGGALNNRSAGPAPRGPAAELQPQRKDRIPGRRDRVAVRNSFRDSSTTTPGCAASAPQTTGTVGRAQTHDHQPHAHRGHTAAGTQGSPAGFCQRRAPPRTETRRRQTPPPRRSTASRWIRKMWAT